jgi:SRSO17 transposase
VSGAPIETTLELWTAELREAKRRTRPLFAQERVAASAGQFLDGLLGPERRKTGWTRAEAAGDPGPWRQQAILGRGRWEADALRDIVRDYALEALADSNAVLVIDETGFLKRGKASCGAGRQHTGSAGKIANCQIGVFAAYASRHGHALIDRAPCLPKHWTTRPGRQAAVHVPPEERAIAAGVPFAWVTGDSAYGVGALEMPLRRAGKGCVPGVNADSQFNSWIGKPEVAGTAEAIAQDLDASAWQRLSAGEGTKGARLHEWACLDLAGLDADEYRSGAAGVWTRGLLIRRNVGDGEQAYFSTCCPARTGIETLAAVEGQRWAIEDAFATANGEFGLDHNEARSWHGGHRHVSLVMPAFAVTARIRQHANQPTPPKSPAADGSEGPSAPDLIRWSIQGIRRIAVRLAQRRIRPAHVIAWSPWRRAHQAAARRSHLKRRTQL